MAQKKATAKQSTKTDSIREELKSNKDGSPSQIAKKLVARGIKVTPEYVSTIKASDKRKAMSGNPRQKPGRPPGRPPVTRKDTGAKTGNLGQTSELITSELMLSAVELVLKAGPAKAKQLINTAQKLVERVNTDS